ncbi:GPO family capsid scaffolding protein [Pseudomonas sp. URMO17WK12:I2]|uniref:GPO family capsid scaffolding protein n=1 Tax=Pseudomonas sp. URMO17WK12:I2 TaxID=1261623 RepID=UPI000DADF1C8|nr:GPO family capsid scaffolding protein [Pseudomonas sp. URMO17WK12:I2]PZW46367.1 capsid scaffolding serine peptidase GPO [Pseudomonas sp. URMO17WK12:I2]
MSGTKKTVSKWTRIALEGATTDGRKIEPAWITQMAASYDRNLYGARLNCEHIKSVLPDSPFGAYGDVLELKAEKVEIGGKTKLALFARMEPNEALIALNKKRQKIYTSIEVDPEFADTKGAYLKGVAITDNPASLGTEALEFSAQHGTLAGRKSSPDTLFTAAEQIDELIFEEQDDTPGMFAALRGKVSELLGKNKEKEGTDAANFSALGNLIEDLATHGAQQAEAFTAVKSAHEKLQADHTKLAGEFADLLKKLGDTQDHSHKPRPPVTGGDGATLTDC